MACRSEPGPQSAVFVTVKVDSRDRASNASSLGRNAWRRARAVRFRVERVMGVSFQGRSEREARRAHRSSGADGGPRVASFGGSAARPLPDQFLRLRKVRNSGPYGFLVLAGFADSGMDSISRHSSAVSVLPVAS